MAAVWLKKLSIKEEIERNDGFVKENEIRFFIGVIFLFWFIFKNFVVTLQICLIF